MNSFAIEIGKLARDFNLFNVQEEDQSLRLRRGSMNINILKTSIFLITLGFNTVSLGLDSNKPPTKKISAENTTSMHSKKKNTNLQNNPINSQLLADELALDASFTDPELLLELSLRETLLDSP